ncbi:HD superfamily hydrolase [Weissella oryzae SG25]|uniref:bis(5'-nucleosyl)-tetraphosphatase (symmetrical) n=1 Tax=Weissella oryzae (strain DSM 25784 / JCM 18191 / LMG 30913 / SG25) TaxID=1329250 RepID=A0A069CT59_WEIOS|nr:bis(5'-nucleosyl)-tetraphosphatase (symmetrical) YqeK [Weissella oryzae]GAK30592.1 HD superfamily hydrolase [Weissella oryzae SG25]
MTEINYQMNIFAGNRNDLLEKIKAAMSVKRYEHVLRVETMALQLAEKWGVPAEIASIAALVHDYAKERSDGDFLTVIREKQLSPTLIPWGNNIWHGIVGAEMIKDDLKIMHEDILDAVRNHTTGAVYMSKLSQIIYMADYIEVGREFPGVAEVRALAFEDLAASVGWQTRHTLSYLIDKQVPVYPGTLETYNTWSI